MRRFILALVLAVTCSACIPVPPVSLSPQGKTAYTADQIVQRVNELENAAIQANSAGGLDTNVARVIVSFAVAADKTLKATPQGWQVTIETGWAEVKRQLPMITNPALAVVIGAMDSIVATLGGIQ